MKKDKLSLPKGWEMKKIGELCRLERGHNPPKSQFINEPKTGYVRFYQIRDGWSNDYAVYVPETDKLHKVENDDILMVAYRHIGRAFRGVTGAFNVALCKISNSDRIILDDDYLFYLIPSDLIRGELLKKSERSLIPSMSVNHLKNIPIPLPPLLEQQRIVSILDRAFAAIDKAKANAEQNLINAKELFESYLQQVFENKREDWEEKKIGEVCNLARGHNPPKSQFISEPKDGYVRFYQIRDGWSDKNAVYVPDNTKLHRVNKTDILMVAYRHIGRVFRGVSGAFNVALCKLTNIKRDILNDDFLFYMIPTNIIKGELMKRSERSLIPSMSVNHLKEIIIPLPPFEEQQKIVSKLDALQKETKRLETIYTKKIADLEELKKSVLQKAFTGALTDKEVSV